MHSSCRVMRSGKVRASAVFCALHHFLAQQQCSAHCITFWHSNLAAFASLVLMLLLQTFLLLCLLGRHSKAAISTCNLSGEVSAFKVLIQFGTKGVACLHRAGNRAQDCGRKHLQLYGVSSLVNKVYAALAHLAKHTMLTFLLLAPSQIFDAHVSCRTWLPVTGQHAICWRGNVRRDV